MFIDEETEAYMKNSSLLDSRKRIGLWRIIVVRNVPYADSRRNGKVGEILSPSLICSFPHLFQKIECSIGVLVSRILLVDLINL